MYKCRKCCFIWYGKGSDGGRVIVGCAHCRNISKKLDLSATYDADLIDRQIEASREGHKKLCTRPVH